MLLMFAHPDVFAQQKWSVTMSFFLSDSSDRKALPDHVLQVDSARIPLEIGEKLRMLYDQGYLSANYSYERRDSLLLQVSFFTGDVFLSGYLCQGNMPDEILNKAGYKPLQFYNKPFAHGRITKLFNSILDYAENHGYPFASVRLDSVKIEGKELSACLHYSAGPLIVFDSLVLRGFEKVKTQYLMAHLGMYKGRPYEENIIQGIRARLGLLPFLRVTSEPEILIRDGKYTVVLELQQQKVSEIDGILGLLPNESTESNMLITGRVLLDLKNLFASGKSMRFEWQRYDVNSQLMNIAYYHPNIVRTPINTGLRFDLLKQDTTFLNRSFGLDLSMLTSKANRIGFMTDFFSSRLISTSGLSDLEVIPGSIDFNLNYYGINYEKNRIEERGMPSTHWRLGFNASVGQKKIVKNPAIPEIVYENAELNTTQYKLTGSIEKFWFPGKTIAIRGNLNGGYLNGNQLFTAELFRLGGLKSLRGFTEQSIFASGFGIFNAESRFYFSEESHLLLFFDQGIIANDIIQAVEYQFGAGAGLSFDTEAGLFSIVFALGKSELQPFDLSYSKIHFGYVSRF